FLKSAAMKYKTGEGTMLEKVTAETQLKDVQNLLEQNQSDITIYKNQLSVLLGVPVTTLADPYLMESVVPLLGDTSALSKNPNLSYLRQQVLVAEKQRKVELAKALPDVTLGYFNQSLTGFQNSNGTEVFYGRDKRFQGFQLGLAIPIFYGSFSAKAKAAAVTKEIVANDLDLSLKQTQGQYAQAVNEYLKNGARFRYFKTSALANAALILKNSRIAYQNGEIGYAEYLLNLKQVNAIQENHLMALLQLIQSINQIEYLKGNN
ncbi:MAG: TolC family protein, partial [Bacteroidota bacterium]